MNWKMLFSFNLWIFLVGLCKLIYNIEHNHLEFNTNMFMHGIIVVIFAILTVMEILNDRLIEIQELLKSQKKEN